MKNKKQSEIIKTIDKIKIPNVLRTEVNFIKYPLFDLNRNNNRDIIEIIENIETDDGKVEIYWKVKRPLNDTFPGAFDKKMHKAIEVIINSYPRPVVNPIKIGSLRELCGLMGITRGKGTKMIKDSLNRLIETSIKAKGTFYLKKNMQYIDRTFHLYDSVVFTGQKLADGRRADAIYLYLGELYLQNINANYVTPLNWNYYLSLDDNISKRMYEFFSIYFFAALENNNDLIRVRYSKICNYFPLIRQQTKKRAGNQLATAHKKLTETGYFAQRPEWIADGQPNDWIIHYKAGERAISEWQENKKKNMKKDVNAVKLLPNEKKQLATKTDNQTVIENKKELNGLYAALIERGVSEKCTKKLIECYSKELIQKHIDYFDFLKENHPSKLDKNPGGFLRKSIEEDFAAPGNYISPEEIKQREEKRVEIEKNNEMQHKLDAYNMWKEAPAKQKVYWDLMKWKRQFKQDHDRPPSVKEIQQKEDELIKILPTDEEKQIDIFGKVIFTDQVIYKLVLQLNERFRSLILTDIFSKDKHFFT